MPEPITPRTIAVASIVLIICILVAHQSHALGSAHDATETVVSRELLAEIPGKHLTVVRVDYKPGEGLPGHNDANSVFVYVVSGAVRSQVSATGVPRVYRTGEGFFEPPGSTYRVENASTTEAASCLALFVTDDAPKLMAGHE